MPALDGGAPGLLRKSVRFGAFCFPGLGHLNPMLALASALQARRHEVVIFGIADTETYVRAAGLEFHGICAEEYPPGTLGRLDRQLSQLSGLAALRFTLRRVRQMAREVLRDGPRAVSAARVEALLVDEADFAGSIADLLHLPWVSVALIPPLLQDDRFPPFWFGWPAGKDRLSRLRNRIAMLALSLLAAPIFQEVNTHRRRWGLKPFTHPEDALSPLAQVAQLPAALEFDVEGSKPRGLHYTGPFVRALRRLPTPFPWDILDDRKLVYASLGTLQNGSHAIFKTIAEACAGLDVQLVISLGGGLAPEELGALPGQPVVVGFAPQLELLKRATLVITHAGLNTVMESLAEGVPLIAIPLANDQPGVAARLRARGAGVVLRRRGLRAARLRRAVISVLRDEKYRQAAKVLQAKMFEVDGATWAAEIVEAVVTPLCTRASASAQTPAP